MRSMITRTIVAAVVLAAIPARAQTPADPMGFVPLVNQVRAAHGLAPVGYDAGLAGSAASNNLEQMRRGMGHFVSCGTGQCSAMAWDAANAMAQWVASPSHLAIILSPAATACGFACSGGYATLNVGAPPQAYQPTPAYQPYQTHQPAPIWPANGWTYYPAPASYYRPRYLGRRCR